MIVLFDIDGTLTTGSDCGRRSLERALQEVLGTRDPLEGAVLHGNIDWIIVRDAARAAGLWPEDVAAQRELVRTVLERYRDHFARAVDTLPYRALPSAAECVRAAHEACALVGLATGNVEHCARAKLRSAGLGAMFDGCVGGFGDEAESRAAVVALAAERTAREISSRNASARERYGVLVVGDTPLDVSAAHAAGARAAGVATGRFDESALRAAGADWTYPTLAELLSRPPWA